MFSTVLAVTGLSIFGGVISLLGGLLMLSRAKWTATLSNGATPFAAGVLLTVALVGLMPEASHELGQLAFVIALVSLLAAYLFESFVCELHHHCDAGDHGHSHVRSAWLVMVGDTIHNFIDGVAIAGAYLVSPGLGLATAASTFLHEVPHEMGDFGILLKAGWSKPKIIFTNLFSALATVVGALIVVLFIRDLSIVKYLLAISAGIFLYLGASDFLPHAHQTGSRAKTVAILLLGVVVMLAALWLFPHQDF